MRARSHAAFLVVALSLSSLLAACGGDDSNNSPGDHPAGLLVAGDFDIENTSSESSNLMFALQEVGFPLDTTSAMDSTSIAALIAGKDIVFLPEVTPTFDAGTAAILKQFVDIGGTLVLVGGYRHLDWVNAAFALHLVDADSGWNEISMMPRVAANGTPFAIGPDSIMSNDGGSTLVADSLPGNAKIAYYGTEGSTDGSVVVIPSGSGRLVYFGWDWYDGAPFGTQNDGWLELLERTAGF
jgi:hypothetical protein